MRIIAGEARGRRLLSPSGQAVRPPLDRLRESLFQILEGAFEGKAVLDLFAGTGSMGLEAVSRGARHAVFVDSSEASLQILRKNIERTGFQSRCEVIRGDALMVPALSTIALPGFALVFLDPPFQIFAEGSATARLLSRIVEILGSPALQGDGSVILRHPAGYRGALPVSPADTRRYGESVVCRFRRKPERS